MADTAEVGQEYEIEITEESPDEPFGIAYIGEASVTVPNAKVGDKLKVKVMSVVENYWTQRKEAFVVKV